MREITKREAMRYNRQIMIPGFDFDCQERLISSKVLIIGAGGLGCSASQFLVASGIGELTIVDDDKVELHNLQRQILHFESDVGRYKVESVERTLLNINHHVNVNAISSRVSKENISELVERHDVVLDCSDNLATRNLLNETCYQSLTPLVSGAAIRMEGQVFCIEPTKKTACYACISRFFGEQQLTCVESGILSPVVGVIGSTQAVEAIKVITGFGEPVSNGLQLYDAMTGDWQRFKVTKQIDCKVCACKS